MTLIQRFHCGDMMGILSDYESILDSIGMAIDGDTRSILLTTVVISAEDSIVHKLVYISIKNRIKYFKITSCRERGHGCLGGRWL